LKYLLEALLAPVTQLMIQLFIARYLGDNNGKAHSLRTPRQ
jgi:hypothetical protein